MERLESVGLAVVRFTRHHSFRIGRFRLAVLAERSGPGALVVDATQAIAFTCLRNKEKRLRGCTH